MIENIDRHLGALVQAVADRGELERTLIVFSDHGEMLGDHDRWAKDEGSSHVPLVIAGPGITPQSRNPCGVT